MSDGSTQLTVTFLNNGLDQINGNNANGYSDYYMVIYYTADVKSTDKTILGNSGNKNKVTLTWERTSSAYTAALEDECYVYSYGMNLTKSFSDGSGDYSNVTFTLYNQTDGYYIVADQESDGVYWVTGKAAAQDGATVFKPNTSDGTLIIYGLEGDTYGLQELTTDNGYSLLADQVIIDITTASRSIQASVAGWTGLSGYNNGQQNGLIAKIVGDVVTASARVDEVDAVMLSSGASECAIVKLAVTNTRTFILPLTGGAGLYAVTILGIVVFAFGCYVVFGRKKNNEKMNEE